VLDAIADARRRGIAVMLVTAAASTIFVGSPGSFQFVDASSPKLRWGPLSRWRPKATENQLSPISEEACEGGRTKTSGQISGQ
jgi:hypothetical protein